MWITPAHHVAETQVDNIDRLALIVFAAAFLEFGRDQVADAAELHMPKRVGRSVGKYHLAGLERCPFRNDND